MDIRALAYIRIETTDLERWRSFGTDILGMMIAPEISAENRLYLKMDEYSYRYCVVAAATDRFACAGWEVPALAGFEQALSELDAAGISYTQGSDEEAAERNVRGFIKLKDPAGHDLEICYNPRLDYHPLQSSVGVSGTRVVTAMGRHTNDKMVSAYVESPAGFALEYGFDGVQIDWQNYTPTESSTTSHWGHRWNQG